MVMPCWTSRPGIQTKNAYEQNVTDSHRHQVINVVFARGGFHSSLRLPKKEPECSRLVVPPDTGTTGGNVTPERSICRSMSATTASASACRPRISSQRGDSCSER